MTPCGSWIRAVLIAGALAQGACGPKAKPLPPPPPPPPPKVTGDLLRLNAQPGQTESGKVSLQFDNTVLQAGKKKAVKLAYSFTLTEEHTFTAVDPDGTQHLRVRLMDVEAKADNPKQQGEADSLARVLQEVKIAFDRSSRGEVSKLEVEGASKPTDRNIARTVVGSIYGAGRGYLFPEARVEVGNEWRVNSEVPIPAGPSGIGGNNTVEFTYHYDGRDGTVASISFDGKTNGFVGKPDAPESASKLLGTRKGTLKLDLKTGALLSHMVDTEDGRGDPGGQPMTTGSVTKVHVQWDVQPATTGTAPATQAPAIQPLQ